MHKRTLETSVDGGRRSIVNSYQSADDLDEAIELYGKEMCFAHLRCSWDISFRNKDRVNLAKTGDKHMTDAKVLAKNADWQPTLPKVILSEEERVEAQINALSPEKRAALIAKLS